MNPSIVRTALEKKLQGTTGSWERIPLLLQLAEAVDKTDPQYSHQCAAEALALAEQLNDRFWIASCMQRLGLCIAHTYRHSETLHYLQSASRIFAQINEPRMKAKTDYAIARTFNTMGEFHKAAPLLEDSMRVFRSANDSEWIALTLLELGDVWQGVGEHGKGLLFYRRALRRAIKMERTSMTAGCYQAIALAYRMLGNMKGCRFYLHKCAVAYRAGKLRFQLFYERMIGGVGWFRSFFLLFNWRFRSARVGGLSGQRFLDGGDARLGLLDHCRFFGVRACQFTCGRD